MHRELLAAGVYRVFLSAAPDFVGRTFYAVCQDIAESFTVDDHLGQAHNLIAFSPAQFQASRHALVDDPIFIALDGKGNTGAGGNRIDAGAVAHFIDLDDDVEVVMKDKAAKSIQAFILRFSSFQTLIAPLLDLNDTPTAQRAGLAGIGPLFVFNNK